ncbi:MAG: HAMP domain-containing histidine kinase [Actinobacteria bacterium]|nr:HAMP domain-containing histidine kinase [Actinomycetota bacterium]
MPATLTRPSTWTLRSQVLVSVLALFTAVMLVTGALTVGFTKRHLDQQLRDELAGAQSISSVGPSRPNDGFDPDGDDHGRPPTQRNSSAVLRAVLVQGRVPIDSSGDPLATITSFGAEQSTLTDGQVSALEKATSGLGPDERRVDLGDAGTYLVAARTAGSTTSVVGVPTGAVDRTLASLIEIVTAGLLLGLAIVGVGGNWLVRRNLAPLARVADTAKQVSRLRLDSGEVALPARVSPRDADGHTEVGQVGQALNTLLDNVEDALKSRQHSEMRVRQFVADASHELRTPLASIRGYAELSRREREPVPPTVTHALGRVESEALRMQGLVEDLLLLARLDSGRPLEREPVDITLLTMDVVSDAHAAAPDHQWELDLPEEPIEISGDRARLHQVLANLLANARTHTPEGTRVITRIRREGAHVRVSVEDNGPGIPADLQPNVFERFTRGDDSRARVSGSTGLGLSIVAAVAGAHAGRVELESAPGRTVFSVLLPAS